jgi:hypothetical protein
MFGMPGSRAASARRRSAFVVRVIDRLRASRVVNQSGFGTHAIPGVTRALQPTCVVNLQGFGTPRLKRPDRLLQAATVQNLSSFGAPAIANLVHETRELAPTAIANLSSFVAQHLRVALRFVAAERVVNVNAFGAPTIVPLAGSDGTISAILPSDLDTAFVAGDGTARSVMAGGALANLDP